MLTSGVNLEEFKKNPVMLLNHNDWSLPIGRWENIRVEDGKIMADPVFDLKDEEARKVAEKVDGNFLRMASIGAWPPEEVSHDPGLKLEGQKGVTVTKWTVREASIVTIGANHNALAFYDRSSGSRIDLKDQSALIRLMDGVSLGDEPQPEPEPEENHQTTISMTINQILKLGDNATQAEQEAAVAKLASEKDALQQRNQELSDAIAKHEQERKEARKAEAIALVDDAVKSGVLDAGSKDAYLKLFDANHDAAKAALEAMPKRQPVAEQLEPEGGGDDPKLKDEPSAWERRMAEIRGEVK